MTTLINIYDRIQSYQDQQQLANYIADMGSASSSAINISDPNLVRAVNYLESSIKSNIVLNQYKAAIDSFKQWVFPFANSFLERPMLPSQLEMDKDLEDLVSNAVTHIENLRTKVEIYKTSILINDKHLLRENSTARMSRRNHFSFGKKALRKFDIKTSVWSGHESLQSQINKALKRYDISGDAPGQFLLQVQRQILLDNKWPPSDSLFLREELFGEPVRVNNVYIKIRNGDLMLSPYAVWEVKLTGVTDKHSFQELEVYKDKVDLELAGRGSYVAGDVEELNFAEG
ncbi:uncharacterized protein CEXT_200941 [Caerostris extrusa]|uniref:Uncharacterized protein n=1 Tax=Caerostris extrusa TaxID=172846 RepID=A0AAV4MP37_CAEEX|nr:uncharacterized protein CEXT_200941 [Caerostris extrusa]